MDKHVGISFTDKLNPFISWMSINKIADSCVASIPSFGVTWRLARKSLYNIHTIYSLQECNSIICQHLFSQKGVVPLYTSKANCTFCTFFTDKRYWWPFEQLGKKSSNSDGQSSFIRNVKDFRRLIATSRLVGCFFVPKRAEGALNKNTFLYHIFKFNPKSFI